MQIRQLATTILRVSHAGATLLEPRYDCAQVFDFSRDEMTSAKAKKLKESFNADFSLIFQLCEYIMANSVKPTLLVRPAIECTLTAACQKDEWRGAHHRRSAVLQ